MISMRPMTWRVATDGTLAPRVQVDELRLSQMAAWFDDQASVRRALAEGSDPVVYRVEAPNIPGEPGHLRFVVTVIHSGQIGDEAFETRGHFHIPDSGEVYMCLSGRGVMLMQDRNGDAVHERIDAGSVTYVPPGWAHRTANDGPSDLVVAAVYYADAKHDYDGIGPTGFRDIVVSNGTYPVVRPRTDARR